MFTCNSEFIPSTKDIFVNVIEDLKEKYQKGKCGNTPNENQRIIFSLYFAYAVDVATDLASTFRESTIKLRA